MYIKKRDGRIVEFDFQRIIDAIIKAMSETKLGIDEGLAGNLATEIELELQEEELLTVEEIQDLVENKLMDSDRKDVAKAYILYRNTRQKTKNKGKYKLLDDDFISQYKHRPSNMQPLGEFVYYRTYSRFLPEENRRETWLETSRRAVEYNCSLVPTTREEAQELFDNVYNLRQFLSGRSFWVGGTEVAEKFKMSNFNCFREDTEFLTKDGIRTFENFLDGDMVEVLNANGAWSESKVKNFGEQELIKLTVRRRNTKYTEDIYTTAEHLWFVDRYGDKGYIKKETKDLKKGDILRRKTRYEHQDLNMCPIAIKHGIVYGDGTFDKKKEHCRISLIGKKQELVKYFNDYPTCSEGKRDSVLVYGLPYYFKKLPSINANPEYLKGFIYGLLLTDGSLDTSVRLDQRDEFVVRQLQGMCEKIGITTSKVKENIRVNKNFGEQYANTWGFTIHKESLVKHGLFFEESMSPNWVVESVENTGKTESVWCVVEPKTNSFTLRGGIHTHNCSFEVIDDTSAFHELFYLLMLGSGVGIRITKEDVKGLPKFRNNYKLYHKYFNPIEPSKRAEQTSLIFEEKFAKIIVGDSKNGWVDAMKYFLSLTSERQYDDVKNIMFDYNSVRPHGEKLKTFGGTASGHGALKDMFTKIDKMFRKHDEEWFNLKPINCLDICNIIAEGIIVGGVRRSSEIALFDSDDEECIQAKSNLYKEVEGKWIVDNDIIHRSMSNNSIYYTTKPTRERLHWQIEKMRYSGEPAFINQEAGAKRRENFNGVNPCFTHDMKLLTDKGYVEIGELENKNFNIVSYDGQISKGRVWCSGEKETIKLTLSNGVAIKCTPNHIFMTEDGREVKAQNLLGKRIMPFIKEGAITEGSIVLYIQNNGMHKVYDFNEPINHWGIIEGCVVHNCAEILLDSKGMCNLTTVNVMGFVKDGILNVDEVLKAQGLSARAGYRMTCVELELPKWNKVQQRDKLIGCSLTGWQDMVNATKMTFEEQAKLLSEMRAHARLIVDDYADALEQNRPLLVTTVKPEGTLSQLPTVSSGIHYSHSPYYIRRIRVNSKDPIVKVCEELEYNVVPETGQDPITCKTKVVEFPVKAPEGRTKYDVGAIEQLENYKMFMEYYVDHNASITVHVKKDEWKEVEQWMWDNWDDIVAVSFLPLEDSFYELMPYEAISEETYSEMVESMPPFVPSLITKYELDEEIPEEESACGG